MPNSTWEKIRNEWLTVDAQSGKCRLYSELEKIIRDFATSKSELDREEAAVRSNIRDLEAIPQRSPELDEQLNQSRRYLSTIKADLEAIGARNESVHGFLVKKGYLPNYAFGDDSVELVAYQRLQNPKDDRLFEQVSFIRPASSAIRDLALGNTFYGGGKRVEVNTLDLGRDNKRHIEDWRYCPDCGHLGKDRPEEAGKNCPNCRGPNWGDAGSCLQMVKLKKVRSVIGAGANPGDESESRHSEFYTTRKFFDGRASSIWGVNDEYLTMGLEFVKHMVMREINFGYSDQRFQKHLTICGEEVPGGFAVCHSCGRLADDSGSVHHTHSCPKNKPTPRVRGKNIKAANTSRSLSNEPHLMLYRELASEAVRIHVPVRSFNSAEKMASYQAALLLGLREKFGGIPSHLVIEKEQSISLDDGLPQYALIIFDAIPGGSGFMKSLTTKDSFFEICAMALDALKACSCNNDPSKNGCIKCVYSAVSQRDIPIVSRRAAVDFLEVALQRKDEFSEKQASDFVQKLCTESVLESMLADVFDRLKMDEVLVGLLREHKIKVTQATESLAVEGVGTIGLIDEIDGHETKWLIELQRTIRDRSSGVHTRPDFILTCVEGAFPGTRKIALYTDGFSYHAGVHSGDTLSDDFKKRTDLSLGAAGEPMLVWSLDWQTVENFSRGEINRSSEYWFGAQEGDSGAEFKTDCLSLLFCVMARGTKNASGNFSCPEAESEIRKLSGSSNRKLPKTILQSDCLADLNRIGIPPERISAQVMGFANDIEQALLFSEMREPQTNLWAAMFLDCRGEDRAAEAYRAKWRHFLHTHNVLGAMSHGVACCVRN